MPKCMICDTKLESVGTDKWYCWYCGRFSHGKNGDIYYKDEEPGYDPDDDAEYDDEDYDEDDDDWEVYNSFGDVLKGAARAMFGRQPKKAGRNPVCASCGNPCYPDCKDSCNRIN